VEYIFEPPEQEEVSKQALPDTHFIPSWLIHNKIAGLRAEIDRVKADEKYGELAATNLMRSLCQKDLFYLCYEILGYKKMEEPLHNDMCRFLAWGEKKKINTLLLVPRAHYKSTIATIGRCIQWILKDQDTSVGLFSGDMKNARKFATEIRNQLEKNELLKELFPDILYDEPKRYSDKWTSDEFNVRRTKKGIQKKEPTVKIFGLLQNIPTGDHFDHLLGDDIVDQEISKNEEQMKKVEDQLQYLVPLQKTPDDPIHLVGTRYHLKDAYAQYLEDDFWAVYLRRDIENDKVIFPGVFSKEMLERTRMKIGNYKYQCQYKLDPQDPGDKKFKMEWLRYYEPFNHVNLDRTYLSWVLIVDPANKQKKESDFTAMLALAVDSDWNFYLADGVHDKMNPKERIDAVFDMAKKWGIKNVIYETIAFQDTDAFWIKRQMPFKNYYFEIHEVSHRKQNKFDYILSIQPVFMQGRFFLPNKPIWYKRKWPNPDDGLPQTINIVETFISQYDFFPNLDHDDLLDDVAMGLRGASVGHIPEPQKKPTDYEGAYPKEKKEDGEYDPLAH